MKITSKKKEGMKNLEKVLGQNPKQVTNNQSLIGDNPYEKQNLNNENLFDIYGNEFNKDGKIYYHDNIFDDDKSKMDNGISQNQIFNIYEPNIFDNYTKNNRTDRGTDTSEISTSGTQTSRTETSQSTTKSNRSSTELFDTILKGVEKKTNNPFHQKKNPFLSQQNDNKLDIDPWKEERSQQNTNHEHLNKLKTSNL